MSKTLINLFLVVATFATYYLVIGPLYSGSGSVWHPEKSVKSLMDLDKQYKEAIVQTQEISAKAKQLQEDYAKITPEDRARMSVMVPASIDKVRLLDEVDSIAKDAGLTIGNMSYADGAPQASRGSATISFSVKTTYPKLKELIRAYESSLHLFALKGLSFNVSDKDELTEYSVKLETYFIK
jgi:hypothetical protein